MKTIALRFGESFSPECGTIAAHQLIIDKLGYVWYGKMGRPVATHIIDEINTAASAASQELPISNMIVYVKRAFSPIPGAS